MTGLSTPAVWSEQGTTPGAIEAALRHLLEEQTQQAEGAYAPARVLNLVAIVDREWRGEILNRLERVGRYHPSRTIVCSVEKGRESLDAWATMSCEADPEPGSLAVAEERVEIELGPHHLEGLETIVDPLIVHDLATVVWAPHGHDAAVDALTELADVVLLDSVEAPDPATAIARSRQLLGTGYVVDLGWLRSTPWRERIAASFDPPQWRPELARIDEMVVRHREDSTISALLLVGWMASRLGWEPGALVRQNGSMIGRARTRKHEVKVRLESDARQNVPGLAGITLETSTGLGVSLDRGPGGLSAKRRLRDGREWGWTVLGASRGETGILGEGIRQALLRDPTYGPALDSAAAMLGTAS